MFVVRRPFKNLGKIHTVGSVITEPTAIKRFKGKLAEGKIVEVTEQTYDNYAGYFKGKYGVDIPKLTTETEEVKTEEVKTEEVETEEVETEEVKPTPVKAVATAKAKATTK